MSIDLDDNDAMKLKQIITLGAAMVGVTGITAGVSAAIPAKTLPAAAPVTTTQSYDSKNVVCSNASSVLEQNESDIIATEYSKKGTADCMFVGCGGVF